MMHADIAGLTLRESEKMFQPMLLAKGDSLSDLASSDDEDDGDDEEDEETGQGNLSEDKDPGIVMDIITNTVQPRNEMFWHKQIMLNELTTPG
jgi:hypothetical protein